jgi:hypothetical protein
VEHLNNKELTMKKTLTDSYRGWNISIEKEHNMCSHFRFDITDPSGRSLHNSLGGETAKRAFERAREMIDSEISFADEE